MKKNKLFFVSRKNEIFQIGIIILLIFIFVICVWWFHNYPTSEQKIEEPPAEEEIGEQIFTYVVNENQVTIIDYTGEGAEVNVPGELEGKPVNAIGASAFASNNKIKNIVLAEGISVIGSEAFSKCSSLQQITLPQTLNIIGEKAFSQCSSLRQITLPPNLNIIGEKAFFQCSALQEIIIPGSVEEIGLETFYGCKGLEKVGLEDGLILIGENAFYGCTSLNSIFLPRTLEHLGDSEYTYILFSDGEEFMTGNVFGNCPSLEEITVDGNNSYFTVIDGVLFNKDETWIIRYPQDKEGSQYQIPETVERILYGAFSECENLKEVTIPESVTDLRSQCFQNCTNLAEIFIPDSVKSIGDGAFQGCTNLSSVVMGPSLNELGASAFADTALVEIELSPGLAGIWSGTFENCEYLKTVELGNINYISTNAFKNATALEKINISAQVADIEDTAFDGCISLVNIEVEPGNPIYQSIDGILFNLQGTKLIRYPAGKQEETYQIPEGTSIIGEASFSENRHLQTVTMPESVGTIYPNAFSESLGSIYFEGDCPVIPVSEEGEGLTAMFTSDEPQTILYYKADQNGWADIDDTVLTLRTY